MASTDIEKIEKGSGQPPRLVIEIEANGDWEGYVSENGEKNIGSMKKLLKKPWPHKSSSDLMNAPPHPSLENVSVVVLKEFSFIFARGNPSCKITVSAFLLP